jgi:hypothetical protein
MSLRCEEFAAALRTGGPIARFRARRHAGCCPRCASVRDDLDRIADSLAEVAPLTAYERRIWAAGAGDELAPEPSRTRWLRPALAGVLAATFLAAAWTWWATRPIDWGARLPPVVDVNPPAGTPESLAGVEGLRGSVVALAAELDDLGRRAELLDARKDVDALLARLTPRPASSGL